MIWAVWRVLCEYKPIFYCWLKNSSTFIMLVIWKTYFSCTKRRTQVYLECAQFKLGGKRILGQKAELSVNNLNKYIIHSLVGNTYLSNFKKKCKLVVAKIIRTTDRSENIDLFAFKTWFHFLTFMKHADGCSEQNKYQIKRVILFCIHF